MNIISRRDAHAQGLKRFFTGTPCKRGHLTERFVSNGGCAICINWQTPSRNKPGPSGVNVAWPKVGLVFKTQPTPPQDYMEAAFRYMEYAGWHDAAVQALQKDPALYERFRTKLTAEEQGELYAKLERLQRGGQAAPRHLTAEERMEENHRQKAAEAGISVEELRRRLAQ